MGRSILLPVHMVPGKKNSMKNYCINLDERPDRWKQVQKEAARLHMDIERFPAIKRDRGHDGCKESHMTLLEQLKKEETFMMIVEDDIRRAWMERFPYVIGCSLETFNII